MRPSAIRPRGAAAASAWMLAAALLAGCSRSPGLSNGSVSACYRAIPVGRAAVADGSAKLIGIHRIPLDQVAAHLPAAVRSQLAAENDSYVCAMAFKGHFAAGQVEMADPADQGAYALVLVSSRRLHLVTSIVLHHLPEAFGGRII